jgi:hypothetical protein
MTAADGREKGRTVFSCVIINCVTALAMKYVVPFNEQCRQQQSTKNKKKTKKLLTHFVQHSVIMTARHSNFAVNQIESAHLLYSSKVNSSWLIRK